VIIAIDGPAGSGKSTTAQAVAERLNYLYLDTGAMYRAFGLACHRHAEQLDEAACASILEGLAIELHVAGSELRVWMEGEDVSDAIRVPEAGEWASTVSSWPSVRERLVEEQRRIAQAAIDEGRGVVLDGRDIGTVVFPDAHLKIFMDADPRVRADRRAGQLAERGIDVSIDDILNEILARDKRDTEREHAPLRQASDAVLLDTSRLSFTEQVDYVVDLARERDG
jgi:CMP/dCMP kinase